MTNMTNNKTDATRMLEMVITAMLGIIAAAEKEVLNIKFKDPYARNEYGGYDDYCSGFEDQLKQFYGWSIEIRTAPWLKSVEIQTEERPWEKPFPEFVAKITLPESWAVDTFHLMLIKYTLLPYLRSQLGARIQFHEAAKKWGEKLAPWLTLKMRAIEVEMVEDIVVEDDE